jgi:bifunctional DNA-binding transcriptional regulator/antitoxin component of YhaV-PrlF toxin-antitoxin module
MKTTFTTTIFKDDKLDATGIQVPPEAITALASGKKPRVKVSLNGYTYRSTVAVMGGAYLIPLAKEHRSAAGIQAGDTVEIILELDTEERTIEVPADLAAALSEHGVKERFDQLAYSVRKEHVRQVESAKGEETRKRRIEKIVGGL